jgi:hypothetical protein
MHLESALKNLLLVQDNVEPIDEKTIKKILSEYRKHILNRDYL